jgi:predicted metal-binding membrane protein
MKKPIWREEEAISVTSTNSSNLDGVPSILVRDKLAVGVSLSLLGFAAVSWIASYYLMPMMAADTSGMMAGGVAGIVSSSSPLSITLIGLFEIIWIVGMAAMMFPAMIPIVLFYNRVSTKLEPNPRVARVIGTPIFLGGYLITYAILGLVAYLSVYAALNFSMIFPSGVLSILAIVVPAAVLIGTGIYQFTPLKFSCLAGCISPIGFFSTRSRKGLFGSLRMGFSHGSYCVGCCWAYMLVMLVVGAMSLPVMAILAGVIALEKVIVRGSVWFGRIVGLGFILAGVLVVLFPNLLALV